MVPQDRGHVGIQSTSEGATAPGETLHGKRGSCPWMSHNFMSCGTRLIASLYAISSIGSGAQQVQRLHRRHGDRHALHLLVLNRRGMDAK